MDYFLLIGLITLSVLIVSFTIYSALTNNIIKDQEREINKLTIENKRLESSLGKLKNVKDVVISEKESKDAQIVQLTPAEALIKSNRDFFKDF